MQLCLGQPRTLCMTLVMAGCASRRGNPLHRSRLLTSRMMLGRCRFMMMTCLLCDLVMVELVATMRFLLLQMRLVDRIMPVWCLTNLRLVRRLDMVIMTWSVLGLMAMWQCVPQWTCPYSLVNLGSLNRVGCSWMTILPLVPLILGFALLELLLEVTHLVPRLLWNLAKDLLMTSASWPTVGLTIWRLDRLIGRCRLWLTRR